MFIDVALQQMPEKLQQLCDVLRQASHLIVDEYARYNQGIRFEIMQKIDDSPVTQADIKSHQYICAALLEKFGDIPVLSEEGELHEREQWKTFWLLDPLDGTKEFLNKTGEFTINLSLVENGISIISAIAVPLKQIIYINQEHVYPYRYQWSTMEPVVAQFQQDSVHKKDILRIAISRRPERSHLYQEFQQFLIQQNINIQTVAAGSAYKFCMMLEGEIDIYPRFHPTSEWDTAAGQGLLQSIGGNILSLKKQPFFYNVRESLLNHHFIAVRDIADWQLIEQFVSALSDQD